MNALDLLTNHVHMIATPQTERALSAFVKWFAQAFALWRNRVRNGSGKLFECRFTSVPILSDEQLEAATAYCDLNALWAGLVRDPLDYKWSTYALHAGEPDQCAIPASMWRPTPWYLGLGATAEERAHAYRQLATGWDRYRTDRLGLPPSKTTIRRPDRTRAL